MQPSEPAPDAEGDLFDYTDRVRVSIRLADGGALDEYVHTVWDIQTAGGLVSRSKLVRDIQAIPTAPRRRGEDPLSFALDVRDSIFEWGASSAAVDVVMYLAAGAGGGIVGNAAYDATKALVKGLGRALRSQHPDRAGHMLEEREVLERTRWLISERFKESGLTLELVAVEVLPDHATVTYRSYDKTYTCDLAVVDGMVTFTRIRRDLDA